MIEAVDLTRDFGGLRAVDHVSFRVKTGEAVGFLGPNGAGKTTIFRMLTGSLGPSSGNVFILGQNLLEAPLKARSLIGYMPENAPLYPEMTVREYLSFRAELKKIPGRRHRALSVQRVSEQVRTSDLLGTRIGHLSKGYRQRVALSEALLGDPPGLLLDEPTAGLDPNQVADVRRLIRKLAEDRAVLLSTHVLSEVEATCHRAIVMNKGRVISSGTLEELRRSRSGGYYVIAAAEEKQVRRALHQNENSLPELRIENRSDGMSLVRTSQREGLSAALKALLAAHIEVTEAGPERAPLDQVFEQLTREEE